MRRQTSPRLRRPRRPRREGARAPTPSRSRFEGSRVLLGVTGSIAAYKAVEIARLLIKAGARVRVAMTAAAARFVGPITFEAITGQRVLLDLFDAQGAPEIEHVERAHEVDAVVVAPATANSIARLAHGFADDPISAIVLSTRAPVLIAPAMETGMWENAATQANLACLIARGVHSVGPEEGDLASGRSGRGRMAEPETVCAALAELVRPRDLGGLHVVITAGATWESLDPVRILSNRSTGAMGIEIARAAAIRGAQVSLILGPTHLQPDGHPAIKTVRVESAEDMLRAAREVLPTAAILIGAAAVSDFRPAQEQGTKLKRSDPRASTLALAENPDILLTLASVLRARRRRGGAAPTVVGFAAETEDVERHAREKLRKKQCDLVIGNLVGKTVGFGAGLTEVVAVTSRGASLRFGPAAKGAIAQFVLDRVVWLRKQQKPG